jgi:hypothetical protein
MSVFPIVHALVHGVEQVDGYIDHARHAPLLVGSRTGSA